MSTWTDIRDELVKIGLPMLGAALPLPGGAAIGAALANSIGAPSDKPEDILAHLTQSAEALQKAREFEATNQTTILKITVDAEQAIYEAEVKDRDSARNREVQIKDNTPRRLAYILIGGFLGVSVLQLVALMFFPTEAASIPPQGWLLIGNISGYLANEAKQAGGYYFGTSQDSGRKTELLAQAPAKDITQ